MRVKNTIKSFFVSLMALFAAGSAEASHMMGADISYQCLSNGRYKIIAKIYRDCRGIPFSGPSASFRCGSYSVTASLTRTSIRDITPTCVSSSKPCNPQNTTVSSEGVEEHTYEITVNFNTSPYNVFKNNNCCQVEFGIGQCCRNGAITTGASGQDFWATAMMDICLKKQANKCNNSPFLTNVPIGYLCCNQPFYFNNGALDTADYDSLSFSLVAGRQSWSTTISYASPLSVTTPMTPFCPGGTPPCTANPNANPPQGFFLDKSTGDIIFTPTKCDEVGIIVIQIDEYRKDSGGVWQLIGRTRRDMQMIVRNCGPNNPPQITGSTLNTICEGDKLCFVIKGTDKQFLPNQTKPDTVTMTWNRGIPGATFTIKDPKAREKEAEFCWQTKIGDARDVFYQFTVTAQDDNCPIRATSVKGFRVKVKKKARDTRSYVKKKCGWLWFDATLENGFQGTPYYKWEIRDSTNAGKVYKISFGKTDSFQFRQGGKYIITHTINNSFNCPTLYLDTIVIPPVLDVQLAFGKDTFVCWGSNITLGPRVSNGIGPFKYYWTRPVTHIAGDTLPYLSMVLKQDSTLALRITDKNECSDADTIFIRVQKLPVVNIGPDIRQCTYDTYTIDAGHADSLDYLWMPNWDTTRTITVFKAGKYSVKVSDSLKCFGTDTMELFVNDTVVSMAPKDFEICIYDTAFLNANGKPLGYPHTWRWTDAKTNTFFSSDSATNRKPLSDNCYDLHLQVTQGGKMCEDHDTVCVKVNPLPTFDYTPPQPKCFIYGQINLHLETAVKPTASWFEGKRPAMVSTYTGPPIRSIYNTNLTNNTETTDTVYVMFRDAKGCFNKDSFTVKINKNPVVDLRDRVYCQDLGEAKMDSSIIIPKVKTGSTFGWRCLTAPSGVDKATVVRNKGNAFVPDWVFSTGNPTETNRQGIYEMEFCIQDAITGCRTCDTSKIKVVDEPVLSFSAIPNQCINWDTLELHQFVTINGVPNTALNQGIWSAISYRGDRTDPKLPGAVVQGHRFLPATGAGLWEVKFFDNSTGCPAFDSMYLTVNNIPLLNLMPPVDTCSNVGSFDLVANPTGGIWTGNTNISNVGSTYTFTTNPGASRRTTFNNIYSYTDPSTGCENKDSVKITVQRMPTVSITTTDPYEQCEDQVYTLAGTATDQNTVSWTSTGTGSFSPANALNTQYNQSQADKDNGTIQAKLTVDAWEKCPAISDSINLIFQHYPTVDFLDSMEGCAPMTVDFQSLITRVPLNQVTYDWDFGNGTTSTLDNPSGILYTAEGQYTVRLTVNNTAGNCSTTVTRPAYIKVYPVPVADFNSDPAYYTTVALTRYRFFNKSNITTGSLNYLWNFGTGNPNDTSTAKDPVFVYGKDTAEYDVKLVIASDKGCMDSVTRRIKIGPDITVFIPNAFSPDGAGIDRNNRFFVTASGYKDFAIKIFNRWGQKVYESTDINEGWDGRYNGSDCQQDVYVYIVNVTSFDDKPYEFAGTVTLLR